MAQKFTLISKTLLYIVAIFISIEVVYAKDTSFTSFINTENYENIITDKEPPVVKFEKILLEPKVTNIIEFNSNEPIFSKFQGAEIDNINNFITITLPQNNLEKSLTIDIEDEVGNSTSQIFIIDNEQISKKPNGECIYSKTTDPLAIVVNKQFCIPKNYIENLTLKKLEYNGDEFYINTIIISDLVNFLNDSEKDGMSFTINSAFRSIYDQEKLYNQYIKLYGKEKAEKLSANPEQSEHHLGTTIDFGAAISKKEPKIRFEETLEYKWIKENGWKYGFVMSYPPKGQDMYGYEYEPWHWRYVGRNNAYNMKLLGNKLTLDQYLQIINADN